MITEEQEILTLPEQFKVNLTLVDDKDIEEQLMQFNDTQQKILIEFFRHPEMNQHEIANITGNTNVWVCKTLNDPRAKNLISKIRLTAIADAVDTNMVKGQNRLSKMLDSDNEKTVLEAIKISATLFSRNITNQIDNRTGSIKNVSGI